MRKVKLFWFIKDFALEIREPYQENSGKFYGKFLKRDKYALRIHYEDGTNVEIPKEQCNPFVVKSGCLIEVVLLSVTIKVLQCTENSIEWLKKHSKHPYTFGNNLDFPKEE